MSNPLVAVLLAAGRGSRLQPYTNDWPKCLMPIKGRPLLEHWLDILRDNKVRKVLVNLHYLADQVQKFLDRPNFKSWVQSVYELELAGTAGTLRANIESLRGSTVLVVHADNFVRCDFDEYLHFHSSLRPKHCPITMMTFTTQTPASCGIVELDRDNIVINFHEKVKDPPGNLANGAVYLLEPEVIDWIYERPEINDLSTQVLPFFIDRIATWHNKKTHIDIGSIEALREAQSLVHTEFSQTSLVADEWQRDFAAHPIHQYIRFGMPSEKDRPIFCL